MARLVWLKIGGTCDCCAGRLFYIPAGVPHQPYNNSNEPAVVLVARSDPNDQESVIMLPELDVLHP
ncbi:cupin domain-containing protein [Xylella fastidiosa]|uniref:cupin domain-containing protein n=1 Tax=Xylella fastidiosa TaxID=2371 RepID=UPI0030830F1D